LHDSCDTLLPGASSEQTEDVQLDLVFLELDNATNPVIWLSQVICLSRRHGKSHEHRYIDTDSWSELGAGVAILTGWRIRDAAGALAIFCAMTAGIFHYQLWINAERTLFFKDLAIAGGLMVMAAGAAARARTKRSGA
jgi:putative oxidoreductase